MRHFVNSFYVYKGGWPNDWLLGYKDSLKPVVWGRDVSKPTKNWFFRKLAPDIEYIYSLEKFFVNDSKSVEIILRYLENDERFKRSTIVQTAFELSRCVGSLKANTRIFTAPEDATVVYSTQQQNDLTIIKEEKSANKPEKGRNTVIDGQSPQNESDQQMNEEMTARQKALLAIFREETVTRESYGNNAFNHFHELRKPIDRIGFVNESIKRAKLLIKDYTAILPYLSSNQRQKAESEIVIIKAKRW